jgi:hypothetical protein
MFSKKPLYVTLAEETFTLQPGQTYFAPRNHSSAEEFGIRILAPPELPIRM